MRSQILLDYAIKPAIKRMGAKYYSDEACVLILATCGQESEMGKYIKQIGSGPALGILQIEPATDRDCWENYINFRPELREYMKSLLPNCARGDDALSVKLREQCLITNIEYSICMARIIYYRSPLAMPLSFDKEDYWTIYKEAYNSKLGAAKDYEFFSNWERFIKDIRA